MGYEKKMRNCPHLRCRVTCKKITKLTSFMSLTWPVIPSIPQLWFSGASACLALREVIALMVDSPQLATRILGMTMYGHQLNFFLVPFCKNH